MILLLKIILCILVLYTILDSIVMNRELFIPSFIIFIFIILLNLLN